jgi:tRNA/rRNA methyltransferase
MRNMGARDLVLVKPAADPCDRQALQQSTHGEAILRSCRIVSSLDEAVADCLLVGATSAKVGGPLRRQNARTLEAFMPGFVASLDMGPAALVFGPEPTGLTSEEIARCHFLVHIPTDVAYPALNLAQAVAICLYELRQTWLGTTTGPPRPSDALASHALQEQMFDSLKTALAEIHFLYGRKAESLFHAVRHLLSRAQPSEMEVKMVLGLARQIRWFARQAPQGGGERPEQKPPEPGP